MLSIASIWEISIKVQLGKLNLPSPLDAFLTEQLAKNQVQLLPIEFSHAVFVHSLPLARRANGTDHKDPFDRLIIAQALVDSIPLVSVDAVLDGYSITRVWEEHPKEQKQETAR